MVTVTILYPIFGLTMLARMSIAKIAAPTANCSDGADPGMVPGSERPWKLALPNATPTEPMAKTIESTMRAK